MEGLFFLIFNVVATLFIYIMLVLIEKQFRGKKLTEKSLNCWENEKEVSQDIYTMADKLIRKHKLVDASKVKIIFQVGHLQNNSNCIGACYRLKYPWTLFKCHYVIYLSDDYWSYLTEIQKEALLLHELLHIKVHNILGIKILSYRDHDTVFGEFILVYRNYGYWDKDLKCQNTTLIEKKI